MRKCPKCYNTQRQNKAGQTASGSQRYRCMYCGSKYTPEKKRHGYDAKVRQQAIRLYVDGMNLRRTARHLGIHHSTVSVWLKDYVSKLPQAPQPKKVKTAEMDELFTFLGNKKTKST
jgi:transposase-like protein